MYPYSAWKLISLSGDIWKYVTIGRSYMPDQSEQTLVVNNAHIRLAFLKYRSPTHQPSSSKTMCKLSTCSFSTIEDFYVIETDIKVKGAKIWHPQKMLLWLKDYFQQKVLEKQQIQKGHSDLHFTSWKLKTPMWELPSIYQERNILIAKDRKLRQRILHKQILLVK